MNRYLLPLRADDDDDDQDGVPDAPDDDDDTGENKPVVVRA